MGEGTFGCQTAIKQTRQFVVVEASAGEAAGGQLLGERFRPQCQFLPRQFPRFDLTLRPTPAKQRDSPPVPGTTGAGGSAGTIR